MNIFCFFGLHKFKLLTKFSGIVGMLYCDRCKQRFAYNHEVECLVKWNNELQELYSSMGCYIPEAPL